MKKTLLYSLFFGFMALPSLAQPGNPTFGLTGSTLFDLDIRPISVMDIEVSAGFELRLDVGSATGSGGGTRGSPNPSTIVITGVDKNVVTGIQSAFTGNGAMNGHQLTFSLHYLTADFAQITHSTGSPIILTYTLVDD